MKTAKEPIEVYIEGGTDAQQRALTMITMNALATAGFTDTHQCDHHGQEREFNPSATRLTMPSVMDYMRDHSPQIFNTPVIVSAYAPPPVPQERRKVNRQIMAALALAPAYEDVDPDEQWELLNEEEKQQILRLADSRRASYAM